MVFRSLDLEGAYLVDLELHEDERGLFARAWCQEELQAEGLDTRVAQCNLAFNHRRGTLRGLHFQRPPYAEVKLVRCTRGSIFDVIVDIRPGSPTYCGWYGTELSADNRRALYVPEGFAHGYQTLLDGTEVFYLVSESYTPQAEGGVRWDDPAFAIQWPPVDSRIISEKDRSWPDYRPASRT